MLQEAINLQNEAVSALVSQIEVKQEITFKAPTGSGKTHMMADFMDRILAEKNNVVFIISSLSKSGLAKQNYNKFCEYKEHGNFSNINPYLISSEIAGEEALFIPINYNVYILPRDLYKKGGRLMQGAMDSFLQTITTNIFGCGCNKQVYLIKDECHIATNNLDTLSSVYFSKILNFSATPKLSRRQEPDVEITEEKAVNAKLIKTVEWCEEDDGVENAIKKFEEIKEEYRNKLGVNPCLIIQISNKDKADEELLNIYSILNKVEYQELKWMLIVDKEKNCNTNDVFKAKKIPVSRWKDYARESTSIIDIIIFKMVITEGWDIPRACMLYQVRDTQSKQLDEQVIGRVRRNPHLLEFEKLSAEAQSLALQAWVWGIKNKEKKSILSVSLYEEPENITEHIKVKTTRLKPLIQKEKFNINDILDDCEEKLIGTDIFTLYRNLQKAEPEVRQMCYSYSDSVNKWLKFTENIDVVIIENSMYLDEYKDSMELVKDENNNVKEVSFPIESTYTDNANYVNISDWVWKRKDEIDKFAFDSEAEREWASILQNIAVSEKGVKKVIVREKTLNLYEKMTDGHTEVNEKQSIEKYLWGKNFVANSEIKYEYYFGGVYSSYPDFVMKDCFGRIHLFEVKSLNISNAIQIGFDRDIYENKIKELIECYTQASLLTSHIFYLPIMKRNEWHIIRLMNGEQETLKKTQFETFIKTQPKDI